MKKMFLLSFLLSLIIFACKNPPEGGIDPEQEVFFEVNYTNYAWGYHNYGFYIDKEGNCYSYKNINNDHWKPVYQDKFTLEELYQKYQDKEQFAQVTEKGLKDHINLIKGASEGEIADDGPDGADAGLVTYIAYRYDPLSKYYLMTVLKIKGDDNKMNKSPEALQLVVWLDSLNDMFKSFP